MATRGRHAGAVTRFRFRPRFRGLAWSAALVGAGLAAAGLGFGLTGSSLIFSLVAGGAGLALAGLYLASPAWRLEVAVDDDALEVLSRGARRFRLPWADVERVVASSDTKTCFVDGGAPERSLLVPGPGAQAPYDIEDRPALYDAIVARAPGSVIEEVPLLRGAAASPARDRDGAREHGESERAQPGPREHGESERADPEPHEHGESERAEPGPRERDGEVS